MAHENKMKDKMTQTTSRQKIIIVVMVIVVLIIIWQIVGLMGNDSGPPAPAIQPTSKMEASKPPEKDMKNPPVQAAASPSDQVQKPSSGPQVDDTLKQASIVNDPQFNRLQRMTEEKYVGKLNELEELRIQRQIAETNQAIAAAKLATVTAEKDISDLLTAPARGSSPYSTNPPPKTSVDVTPPMGGEPSASELPKVLTPPPQEAAPYKLMSVSLLFNKWTAVVTLQNTMFSVNVGDILPPDGSVVTNINKSSITLKKDGKSRKVSITASI